MVIPQYAVGRHGHDLDHFVDRETPETECAGQHLADERIGEKNEQNAQERPSHRAPHALEQQRHDERKSRHVDGEHRVDGFHAFGEPGR